MKILISFSIPFMLLFLFSSCVTENDDLPLGVWASESPAIVLYIDPVYQNPERSGMYLGFYTRDDETEKIFMTESVRIQRIHIHELSDYRGNSIGGPELIGGDWSLIGSQMHLELGSYSREVLGRDQIIFNRIEDYEPINPTEWFP